MKTTVGSVLKTLVTPLLRDLTRFAHGATSVGYSSNLDATVCFGVHVPLRGQACLQQGGSLRLSQVRPPVPPEDWHGNMKSESIRHEVVGETGPPHVYTAEKRAARLTPSNKDLVPKRIALVAALVPDIIDIRP